MPASKPPSKTPAARCSARAVGDKNVIDEMLREGFNFGGEQSGHLIFRDYGTTGDGLVAALQILRILKSQRHAALPARAMLDAFPAARDQRESAREKTLRAARRREPARGRRRKRNCPRKADGCCCATPARSRKCGCWWKAATRKRWKRGPKKSAARFSSRLEFERRTRASR